MDKPDFLETARKAIKKHYPDCECAFIAGSVARGEGTKLSDIDIMVIYKSDYQNPHRNSVIEDTWPIEFFVNTPETSDYFIEQDIKSGTHATIHMLLNSIAFPDDNHFVTERRTKAQAVLDQGPPKLSKEDIEDRRYFITDLLDDLDENRAQIDQFGTLAKLYQQTGDFYLRTQNLWSAEGKTLGRLIREANPDFASNFEKSLSSAYQGDLSDIRTCVENLLKSFGGRCFEGYKRNAPKD